MIAERGFNKKVATKSINNIDGRTTVCAPRLHSKKLFCEGVCREEPEKSLKGRLAKPVVASFCIGNSEIFRLGVGLRFSAFVFQCAVAGKNEN